MRGGLFNGIAHIVAFDEDHRVARFAVPDRERSNALSLPLFQRKMPGKLLQAAFIRYAHLKLRLVPDSCHALLHFHLTSSGLRSILSLTEVAGTPFLSRPA